MEIRAAMTDDTTPIINRAIGSQPTKDQATQLMWSRVHKLSEKVDILTKIYGKHAAEINELTLALLRHNVQASRKTFANFWCMVVLSLAMASLTVVAVICVDTKSKPLSRQESK